MISKQGFLLKLTFCYHLTAKSDWFLISPYSVILELSFKVMRNKMITNLRSS